MKPSTHYQELLNKEIETRIQQMEAPDYSFPKRFQRKHYLILAIVVLFCLFALVLGAWL